MEINAWINKKKLVLKNFCIYEEGKAPEKGEVIGLYPKDYFKNCKSVYEVDRKANKLIYETL